MLEKQELVGNLVALPPFDELLLPVIIHFLYDVATGLYLSGRRNVANV